jgi:diaminopimelate epimerase
VPLLHKQSSKIREVKKAGLQICSSRSKVIINRFSLALHSNEKMKTEFRKYHGTGNDFILIDNRVLNWSPGQQQVAALCDRHFGIGADGLMLLSAQSGYDFKMTYFNADGKESTMCGNGGRCLTAFAKDLGVIGRKADFLASDGCHIAEILWEHGHETYIRLKMQDTAIGQVFDDGISIDTGSPHFVLFTTNLDETDVRIAGKELRFDPRFSPEGTNVNFAEARKDHLYVRTYERGVENETLSCGTGVTAVALAFASLQQKSLSELSIATPGGKLQVQFRRSASRFTDIWLEGPASHVFRGEVEISEP